MGDEAISPAKRRLRKLWRDPQGYLLQSRYSGLRAIGKAAQRRQDIAIARRAAAAKGRSVGVIVTAYNGAETVARALASLAAQTHACLEIVAVDDASTDSTRHILARFAARDPRFRVLANERNLGPYGSRNRALAGLTTEFVTFLDADDHAAPERIARQLGFLLGDRRRVACVCSGLRVTPEGLPVAINGRRERMEASTLFFERARVLERLGRFDMVRFAGDAEFVGRLLAVFGARGLGRQHEVLLTASFRADSLTREGPGAQIWTQGEDPLDWRRETSPPRLAYEQAFRGWHAEIAAGRASARLAGTDAPRPFPAPASMVAPAPATQA